MVKKRSKFLFDNQDHELISIVNEVINREKTRKYLKNLLVPYLHPNGVKEMAAPKELRIAYAVINLLDMLEAGGPKERLTALRSVRNEVLHSGSSALRVNTGRVLLQIMKELVRAHGDYQRQLELAHQFRRATTGKPLIIRDQLQKYHLLEMPEDWNQITFDDHVHDANTKGRKSPTHLIMDAWIKGIRSLTVIYYNHVQPEAAAELLEAAEIMGIMVRVGLEYSTPFRGGYVQMIWELVGFNGPQEFRQFLKQLEVADLMAQGREVSEYEQQRIFQALENFNQKHLPEINYKYSLDIPLLSPVEFQTFIGPGQASFFHLATFIHQNLVAAFKNKTAELRPVYQRAEPEDRDRIAQMVEEMNNLDPDAILENFVCPKDEENSLEQVPAHPNCSVPMLLTRLPADLTDYLHRLHPGSRITLNLSNLTVTDVLELLYDCKGGITHLEIFNLKDFSGGKTDHLPDINELQRAINLGNILKLKKVIRSILMSLDRENRPDAVDRREKLTHILQNIGRLRNFYRDSPIKSRIGSDSTGRSSKVPGMGLAVIDTLPRSSQKSIIKGTNSKRNVVPIKMRAYLRTTYLQDENANGWNYSLFTLARRLPGLSYLGLQKKADWVVDTPSSRLDQKGNIVSLGGHGGKITNGLDLTPPPLTKQKPAPLWTRLNTGLKNAFKVLVGFVPAFFTFYFTKEWWVLVYFGAVIWFGITGFRNIVQSVLGGGGIRRSPLLRWKDYVSWERVADSLFYTGFSVPLLDLLVKSIILDEGLGINTTTNPIALYTFMALANGLYISGHNTFRGLPQGAIYGNFFRSLLSIPLAVAFNSIAGGILMAHGVAGVDHILQKWAAIISKAASDCVAGVIEGAADRYSNLRMRAWDYSGKLTQVFDTFVQLEVLFPEADVTELLETPKKFIRELNAKTGELSRMTIINALDLLYFWMYQPRARIMLKNLVKTMSREERLVLLRTQFVLKRDREVSQMFVDGLVGKKFSRALSFYLDSWEGYLASMEKLMKKNNDRTDTEEYFSVPGRSG